MAEEASDEYQPNEPHMISESKMKQRLQKNFLKRSSYSTLNLHLCGFIVILHADLRSALAEIAENVFSIERLWTSKRNLKTAI